MENIKADQIKKTGTTTVGLVCTDGLVMASDQRATMGFFIASKTAEKIHPLNDRIAMTIAGGVGDAQTLVRWMKAEIKLYELKNEKTISVQAAATLLSNILAQSKYYPFFVQLLVGGINTDGTSDLYSIDMLGGATQEDFTSTGSGSPIAIGILEEMYKKNGTIKDNAVFAAKAVSTAMKRDAASGENVDVIVIDKEGFKRLKKEEVKKLISA
ncbi:archaeal proteasome endopeptidase complex subunit beta [Candidatus Micrarchaeota archaeon]|nr:archaeal proteasome endopeptidase complex subunit beta [Candidatus Micrarchaeota archaeon]